MAEDKSLSELEQFIGTGAYHSIKPFRTPITDGVAYIMENGYSWLVTDALAVIETKLKDEEFLVVKLTVKDGTADMAIEDGNGKAFHRQHYSFTDAKRDVTLYWENGVLLLAQEH